MPSKSVSNGGECSKCNKPCYDQRCMACNLPLCQQCVSRPHQCGSRCRAALHPFPAGLHPPTRDRQQSKSECGAGPPNAAAWKWNTIDVDSFQNDTEGRDLSSSSMNSETEARELSSSSMSSTESTVSRRPWHLSEPSQALFTQYCHLRRQQQDEECVVQ